MKVKIFVFILFFIGGSLIASSFITHSDGYKVGDPVMNFKLKDTSGKWVSLDDYQNQKGVILIFDCNSCPYSKRYNSRILDLDKKYASKGFPVVAINPNDPKKSPGDSYEKMIEQVKNKKYTFSYLYDETQEVATAFGATNTPHVFILQNDQTKWKVAYIGTIDDNPRDPSKVKTRYVENAVDALLQKKKIERTKTKAIGCTIKWK